MKKKKERKKVRKETENKYSGLDSREIGGSGTSLL
jgi:hypothetical protein